MKKIKNIVNNKRVLIEIILSSFFGISIIPFLGILDKYDFYLYLIFSLLLIVALLAYSRIFVRDLKEIINEHNEEK